jgi:hypothetical protein
VATVVAAAALALGPPAALAVNDPAPPASSAIPPAYATGSTFAVPYTASGGPGASGPARVDLYVQAPGALGYALAASDPTPESPAFAYDPVAGDGRYAFYTVAVDRQGNIEPAPLLGEDGATLVDSAAPTSAAAAPAGVGSAAIDLSYTAADGGSGVARVELWAKPPDAGAWALALTDDTPASPSFSYSAAAGAGIYAFATVAVDRAGNREPAALAADAETTYSAAPAPSSGGSGGAVVVAQAPAEASAPTVPLVATLVMAGKQTLTRVLADGIRFRLYAYRPIALTLSAALTARTARSLGLRRHPGIAFGSYRFAAPGVYQLRLRLKHRAILHLRRARTATLILRTVVLGAASKTTSDTRVRLRR